MAGKETVYLGQEEKISQIYKCTSEFENLASSLGGEEDTPELREQLHTMRNNIQLLLNETRAELIHIRASLVKDIRREQHTQVADEKSVDDHNDAGEKFLRAQVLACETTEKYASYLPSRPDDVLPLSGEIGIFEYGAVLDDVPMFTPYRRQPSRVKFLLMKFIPGVIGFSGLMNMLVGFILERYGNKITGGEEGNY
ncbi:hypothetical protein MKX03_003652 [Papaver bracteatum]|nr:hypothetical protein MKX03_003652 [Papaver bracteatum]